MSKLSFIQDCPELYLVGCILTRFIASNKINEIEINNRYNSHKEYHRYSIRDKSIYMLSYGSLLLSSIILVHAGFGTIINLSKNLNKMLEM